MSAVNGLNAARRCAAASALVAAVLLVALVQRTKAHGPRVISARDLEDEPAVARNKRCTFTIEPDLLERLRASKARTGLPESEQIRQALRAWLDSREWPPRGVRRRDRNVHRGS